jgi:hypothetical protein
MSATDPLEQDIGRALFLAQPFPAIAQWHLVAFTTLPNDAGGGGVEAPPNASGYQRQRLDPGAERWQQEAEQDAQGRTVFSNLATVRFRFHTATNARGVGLRDQHDQLRYVVDTGLMSVAANHELVFLPGQLKFPIG